MARVAVLTDRLPNDPSWKGAYTWEIIRGLVESQHEVAVFTTADPDRIPLVHPRLTVARPASTFTAEKMPRWSRALLSHQPQVVHTFALQPSTLWPALTIWPYMDALCKIVPGLKRVTTMFESSDFSDRAAVHPWYVGSDAWTVFSPDQEISARDVFPGRIDLAPLEDLIDGAREGHFEEIGYTFVPAPVSEWSNAVHGLWRLADDVHRRPETTVYINGGWGDLGLQARRRGWNILREIADRVRLIEEQPLPRFIDRARAASRLWVESLDPRSWRHIMSVRIARHLNKEMVGGPVAPALASGSTANFLSRVYSVVNG